MISVHIITGFLGVGKTTLINNLITQKPLNESWAIIVNEFGEFGVDAILLNDASVTIKQVPGGCACCAANLPFQVSLNQLLKSSKFDRILIEPSGLGHGDKLAELLDQEQYKEWLSLDGVLTLIDPKQFSQNKYREHDIYIRQLQVADAIVVTKSDLASASETSLVDKWTSSARLPVFHTINGNLSLARLLEISRTPRVMFFRPLIQGDSGYFTQGIQFDSDLIFDHELLVSYVRDCKWERVKAVIKTTEGWFRLNFSNGEMHVSHCSPQDSSILEIIHDEPFLDTLEFDLNKLVK